MAWEDLSSEVGAMFNDLAYEPDGTVRRALLKAPMGGKTGWNLLRARTGVVLDACKECGGTLENRTTRGRGVVFCKRACRTRYFQRRRRKRIAYERMVAILTGPTHFCRWCKDPIPQERLVRTRSNLVVYCSPKCKQKRNAAMARKARAKPQGISDQKCLFSTCDRMLTLQQIRNHAKCCSNKCLKKLARHTARDKARARDLTAREAMLTITSVQCKGCEAMVSQYRVDKDMEFCTRTCGKRYATRKRRQRQRMEKRAHDFRPDTSAGDERNGGSPEADGPRMVA